MRLSSSLLLAACGSVVSAAVLACGSFSAADDGTDGGTDGGGAEGSTTDGSSLADGSADTSAPAPDAAPDTHGGVVVLAKGFTILSGIAANDDVVYFTDQGTGGIYAVPLAGGGLSAMPSPDGKPRGVALSAQQVYWCDGNTINRMPLAGGSVLSTVIGSQNNAVALSSANVGVLDSSITSGTGFVAYLGFDLQGSPTVTSNLTSQFDLAASKDAFYWTESGSGTIAQATAASTARKVLAASEADCQSIAADDSGVYWARPSAGLIRARRGPDPAVDVATGQASPQSLTANAQRLYWITSDGAIRSAPTSGGAPAQVVVDGFSSITDIHVHALAVTSKYVVWLTQDGSVLRHTR